MADDVLLNKVAAIERCVARAREEYACEAALDMGHHIIRRDKLGLPQSSRDVFTLLADAHWLTPEVANHMKRMVGFRNIAVHEYQTLQLPITVNIIQSHLDDFLAYSRQMLQCDGTPR